MGYTHYWYRDPDEPREAYGNLRDDARKLYKVAASRGIELAGWNGWGFPVAKVELISFNGADPQDYESFTFPPVPDGFVVESDDGRKRHFDSTKTGYRPYDAVVCALLIRAKLHYGDSLEVSSDGDWTDWLESARDLYLETFSVEPECPFDQEDA